MMADRAAIIAAFRAEVFADPAFRAHADQMQAGIRDMFGAGGLEALLFAGVIVEMFAVEEEMESDMFPGLFAAAMLLRAASGE